MHGSSCSGMARSKHSIKTLVEVWHIICSLIFPRPCYYTLTIYREIARRLPPAAALGRSDVDAILFEL